MRKRIIRIMLTLVMLLGIFAVSAMASETVSGTWGENITWKLNGEVLRLSGTGDMPDTERPWEKLSFGAAVLGIETIIIDEGITDIGEHAFSGYHRLAKVSIPSTVTQVGNASFAACASLKSIDIPEGVTSIGDRAFAGIYMQDSLGMVCGLESITLPDSLVSIGEEAFLSAHYLSNITIPSSVTTIGDRAFGYGHGHNGYTEAVYKSSIEITITGTVGSAAETYAKENDCPFVEIEEIKENKNFTDVQDSTSWYYTPVLWAVEKGITTGTSDTTFSPDNTCTRAEAVTFLWRAMGKPAPKTTECPFVDVKADAWYYDAMMWAYETGVTTGTDDMHFSPAMTLSRSQFVTLLWRAAGSEVVKVENTFKDVKPTDWFCNAVIWANKAGVTTGTGNGVFSPNDSCSRSQVVTMLHRYLEK